MKQFFFVLLSTFLLSYFFFSASAQELPPISECTGFKQFVFDDTISNYLGQVSFMANQNERKNYNYSVSDLNQINVFGVQFDGVSLSFVDGLLKIISLYKIMRLNNHQDSVLFRNDSLVLMSGLSSINGSFHNVKTQYSYFNTIAYSWYSDSKEISLAFTDDRTKSWKKLSLTFLKEE